MISQDPISCFELRYLINKKVFEITVNQLIFAEKHVQISAVNVVFA